MPHMLLYGASHLTRLETWLGLTRDPEDETKPTALDGRALSKARYCAVGGSKFSTIHERVQGINVPPHQPQKGNQWKQLLEDKYKRAYTGVCLGGNDTSAFRDKLLKRLNLGKRASSDAITQRAQEVKFDIDEFLKKEYELIENNMTTVMNRLSNTFKSSKIIFVAIWRRPVWDDYTALLADKINTHAGINWAHRVVYPGTFITPAHVLNDDVHLTDAGYRIFVDQVFSSVLNSFLQPLLVRD